MGAGDEVSIGGEVGSALGAGGGVSIEGRGWDQCCGQGMGNRGPALGVGGVISIGGDGGMRWDQHYRGRGLGQY